MHHDATITGSEYRAISVLASIYALRMLGLFMILPVFALYAKDLSEATPFNMGIALGIYGLTQTLFQIPFGYISDRLGRKPLIILGLLLLLGGSVVAALSQSIFGVIVGRGLQGMGASGGVMMALLADLTREEVRLRAMACIGITIGCSFTLAFVLGPILNAWLGVPGIFGVTALCALVAVALVIGLLPQVKYQVTTTATGQSLPKDKENLLHLYLGVLILHASLVAVFLKIPQAVEALSFDQAELWKFYLPILLASFCLTIPMIAILEKRQQQGILLAGIIFLLALSELGMLIYSQYFWGLSLSLVLFFTAFNILEASLPSLISQYSGSRHKGTALGIFSTLQFLGLFLGGVCGGVLDSCGGLVAVLGFCVILALVWCFFVFSSYYKEV